jgi:sugar lactone lactonase YvrE
MCLDRAALAPAARRTIEFEETAVSPMTVTAALAAFACLSAALVAQGPVSSAVEVVAPAGVLVPVGTTAFPAALGMKVDAMGRLWVAGGRTGRMSILDTRSGKMLKQVEVPNPSGSNINDLALVGSAGYFTDTRTPTMWRLEAKGDQIGAPELWLSFAGTALQYDSGNNLNGIAATPDGRTLIVVQMGKGLLFTIDIRSKAVKAVDTGGADLTGADGLVLDGRTLYVVRQMVAEIATVTPSADMTCGTVVHRFKHPQLAWPATAVKAGDRLIVVNTQFNVRATNTQTLPFTLLSIPQGLLSGAR